MWEGGVGVLARRTLIDGGTSTDMETIGSSAPGLLFHHWGTDHLLPGTVYPSPR